MFSQKQLRSLEILDNYLAKTPENEIAELVKKYAELDIESPTWMEYLHILNNSNFISFENTHLEGCSVIMSEPPDRLHISLEDINPAFCGVSHYYIYLLHARAC